MMTPQEFKEYLLYIADDLQGDDYRKVLRRNLGPPIGEVEKEKIKSACKRLISVLNGREDKEFIDGYRKRIEDREKLKKKYKDHLLDRKDAIPYTGLGESTFDRKVRDEHFTETELYKETKKFRIDDLNKIMRLVIDSSKSALCINTHYSFDRRREGFLPFYGGEYYKIVEENEKFVYLYNERWKASFMLSRNAFEVYFRVEEELKF